MTDKEVAASPNGERKRIKMLVTIVDRGKGAKVVELCGTEYSTFHLSFMGRGTANSDILDILGLGETKKDIIFSIVLEERLERVMEAIRRELRLDGPGNGIAFTIPIVSVGGPLTLQFISGLYNSFTNL
jgi:hypothetical protein